MAKATDDHIPSTPNSPNAMQLLPQSAAGNNVYDEATLALDGVGYATRLILHELDAVVHYGAEKISVDEVYWLAHKIQEERARALASVEAVLETFKTYVEAGGAK